MKLDTKHLRYLSSEDWRVLTAVEIGSKNHEVVPTPLIIQLSNLRGGSGAHKCISTLAKTNLIARTKNAKYDGYRLTYGGLDYLSLHTHLKRSILYSTGPCIGAGKESDIYICAPASNTTTQVILKIHRLGRISFRSIKNNRDYLRHRSSASWMYMSRLAAQKEFAFMKILHENGFNVPEPIAWSRHTVVMGLIEGVPLRAVKEVGDPAALYAELIEIILRLAKFGLIHGDFNEFNIMIREESQQQALEQDDRKIEGPPMITPILIDFPQTLSISHPNAEFYFNRDVNCVKTFFARRFHFTSSEPGPFFEDAVKVARRKGAKSLDVEVEASGFSRKMARDLEKYMQDVGVDGDGGEGGIEDDEENGSDDDDKTRDKGEGVDARQGETEDYGEGSEHIPSIPVRASETLSINSGQAAVAQQFIL
ncbi:MAG: hypothetical protein Q9164_000351 [Protoblastenia rupestris]